MLNYKINLFIRHYHTNFFTAQPTLSPCRHSKSLNAVVHKFERQLLQNALASDLKGRMLLIGNKFI